MQKLKKNLFNLNYYVIDSLTNINGTEIVTTKNKAATT